MLGKMPECSTCHVTESVIWKKIDNDEILCNKCDVAQSLPTSNKRQTDDDKEDDSDLQPQLKIQRLEDSFDNSVPNEDNSASTLEDIKDVASELFSSTSPKANKEKPKEKKDEIEEKDDVKRDTRRKTRKGKSGNKSGVPKGKGRRYIFKKSSTKSPLSVSIPVTSQSLMYKGKYYQIGDVISVRDIDGDKFYCQIRGLLQDQYCEKSVVITWLLPTVHSPPQNQKFDPSTYIIGPEEELPRKLEYFEFVCHAPSDYYKNSNAPYSTLSTKAETCFVWGRMGQSQIIPIEAAADIIYK